MDQQQPQPELPQQDFDIWEFVTCDKCQLAFSPDGVSAPSVPFWITECGHVLCNSHLNADQSCPSCNAQRIELMPLQKEMPPPFSDWFCSMPFKLDALAQAAKFQHERTTGTARYYKSRCEQYRAMLTRVKAEIGQVKALRKENEALRDENARLRGEWPGEQQQAIQHQNGQYRQEPASYVNANGKRRLIDSGLSTSSPRSIHTPIGPPRITLLPNHDPPPLSRLSDGGGKVPRQQSSGPRAPMQPPGSSHFAQQYAYNPPQSAHMQAPTQHLLSSHEQQAPIRQQQVQQNQRRLMPPPPTPIQNRQLGPLQQGKPVQRLATPRMPEQMQFNQNHAQRQAPPTSMQSNEQQSFSRNTGGQFQTLGQAPRRFVPPSASSSNGNPGPSNLQRFVSPTPSGQRRFVPQTPTAGEGRRFVPTASPGARTIQGNGQRTGTALGNGHAQRSAFAPPR